MSAVAKYHQLCVWDRIAQVKSVGQRNMIVLITPHEDRGRPNQRCLMLNSISAPMPRRANHRAMRVRSRQQMMTRSDHAFVDWFSHPAVHVCHALAQDPSRAEE